MPIDLATTQTIRAHRSVLAEALARNLFSMHFVAVIEGDIEDALAESRHARSLIDGGKKPPTLREVAELYARVLDAGYWPHEATVLTAYRGQHPLASTALNDLLRDVANPDGAFTSFLDHDGTPLRVGDPVTFITTGSGGLMGQTAHVVGVDPSCEPIGGRLGAFNDTVPSRLLVTFGNTSPDGSAVSVEVPEPGNLLRLGYANSYALGALRSPAVLVRFFDYPGLGLRLTGAPPQA